MAAAARFQSTPACSGRHRPGPVEPRQCVSIHARVWRATNISACPAPTAIRFNPRPRVAGDGNHTATIVPQNMFQSTPACGGRRDCCRRPAHHKVFQSTPACGGRLGGRGWGLGVQDVSIHARVWRATGAGKSLRPVLAVSIHARVWRATIVSAFSHARTSFNPRPRVAGDGPQLADLLAARTFQSTPACGGRRPGCAASVDLLLFQSTPACGGRRVGKSVSPCGCVFQSTPACGGRPARCGAAEPGTCFNPRPRVAGDLSRLLNRNACSSFQSTPACGGRPEPQGGAGRAPAVSIHARVWRATRRRLHRCEWELFQSTPACGGRRRFAAAGWPLTACFNPRPRVAGDHLHRWFQRPFS